MARRIADALSEIERRVDASDELTAEDRVQIKARAREEVKKRRKDAATKRALDEAIREEERSYDPLQQFEDVTIDLAPYAPFVSLDGIMYFHGLSYSVPYNVARTIDDISARTWEHQNEIDGRRRRGDLNRRPMQTVIGPHGSARAPSSINTRASVLDADQAI